MSFVVRQIARTADGREIARPRIIDADVLTVGRATTSDVHLADLAVTLDHATIRRISPDRLIVATDKRLPFTVDGRSVAEAEIDVASGAEIRFGEHRLLISRDIETDEPRIDVERVAARLDAGTARDEARGFSLADKLPGKRGAAWTLAVAVLALFLVWPVWTAIDGAGVEDRGAGFHGDASWSPGPLSLAHRSLAHDCRACHREPFVAARDADCRGCHAGVHDHADPRRLAAALAAPGMRGGVAMAFRAAFDIPPGRCVDCHFEHQGSGPMPPASARSCVACHENLTHRLPDTRLLDVRDFATAHPEFRPVLPVATDAGTPVARRVSLDADPREDEGIRFSHALHLGGHLAGGTRAGGAGLGCGDCHAPDADGIGFRPIAMARDCEGCHALVVGGRHAGRALPHGDPDAVAAAVRGYFAATTPALPSLGRMSWHLPSDAAAVRAAALAYIPVRHSDPPANRAIAGLFAPGGLCAQCHVVSRADDPRTLGYAIAPVAIPRRYFAGGGFDHRAHASQSCASCHAATASRSAADVLIPRIATCRACHGAEHGAARASASCTSCHVYHPRPGHSGVGAVSVASLRMTRLRISLMSSIANRTPSRPSPLSFTPP